MRRRLTFEEWYNYFEVDTWIIACSSRCCLDADKIYQVTKMFKPGYAGDEAVVHLKGHPYGVGTEYLREATKEEIKAGKRVTPLPSGD